MEAIVLAGGLGTRLRSVVPELPKPLAPVGDKPFLAIVLDTLAGCGFASVVLSVGYRSELVRAAFGNGYAGIALQYAVEASPLGTGGAIRMSARLCHEPDVFVLNGDSYVDVDCVAMLNTHRSAGALLTVCTVEVADTSRYGRVDVDGNRIVGFQDRGRPGPGRINAGVYVMARDLLEPMSLPAAFSFERDVLAAKVRDLRPQAFPACGPFIDIGVPDDYARAQCFFAQRPAK